jgi:hypothetical protein
MLIGQALHLSFATYVRNAGIPALAGLVAGGHMAVHGGLPLLSGG